MFSNLGMLPWLSAGVAHAHARAARERPDLRAPLESAMEQVVRALAKFAQLFPIGLAASATAAARLATMRGRDRRAARLLRRAVASAKRWSVPLDRALALRELASHAEVPPDARARFAADAEATRERYGMTWLPSLDAT